MEINSVSAKFNLENMDVFCIIYITEQERCFIMIYYGRLFALMKEQGKNTSRIREEKIIGQETLRKLKLGTGVLEEYDYKRKEKDETGNTITISEKKTREISVDSKSIESLCTWLNCQPNDIMEVIPNTWENADRLCEILDCSKEELDKKVPMESK